MTGGPAYPKRSHTGAARADFENGIDRAWLEVGLIITRMMRRGAPDADIVDALADAAELRMMLGLPAAARELAGDGGDDE